MVRPSVSKKALEECPPAFSLLNRSLEKIDHRLEKLEERFVSLEKDVSALRVWGSILSFLFPSLLLGLLLWRLKL